MIPKGFFTTAKAPEKWEPFFYAFEIPKLVAEKNFFRSFHHFANMVERFVLRFQMGFHVRQVRIIDKHEHPDSHIESRIHFILFNTASLLDDFENRRNFPRSAVNDHVHISRKNPRDVSLETRTRHMDKAVDFF